jgi:hypothetical protein
MGRAIIRIVEIACDFDVALFYRCKIHSLKFVVDELLPEFNK